MCVRVSSIIHDVKELWKSQNFSKRNSEVNNRPWLWMMSQLEFDWLKGYYYFHFVVFCCCCFCYHRCVNWKSSFVFCLFCKYEQFVVCIFFFLSMKNNWSTFLKQPRWSSTKHAFYKLDYLHCLFSKLQQKKVNRSQWKILPNYADATQNSEKPKTASKVSEWVSAFWQTSNLFNLFFVVAQNHMMRICNKKKITTTIFFFEVFFWTSASINWSWIERRKAKNARN